MASNQEYGSGGTSRLGEMGSAVRDTVQDEAQHVKEAVSETTADLSGRASALADEAVEAAKSKAEDAKDGLSGMLDAFGGALRAASEHLAQEQPAASKMVAEAASGLDSLSSSIGSKPLGSVLEDMRTLGRDNAGGLFAGSVLAGLALGRFFRASDPGGTSGHNASGQSVSEQSFGSNGGDRFASEPREWGSSTGNSGQGMANRDRSSGLGEDDKDPTTFGGTGTGAVL